MDLDFYGFVSIQTIFCVFACVILPAESRVQTSKNIIKSHRFVARLHMDWWFHSKNNTYFLLQLKSNCVLTSQKFYCFLRCSSLYLILALLSTHKYFVNFLSIFCYTRKWSGGSKCRNVTSIRKFTEVKACVNWLSMQQQLITIKLYCHTPFRHLKNARMPPHPFDVPSAQFTTDKSITCRVVDAQHVSSLETIILIKTFFFRHTMEKFSSRSLHSSSQCWGTVWKFIHIYIVAVCREPSWVDVGIKHTYWRLRAYGRALETTWHVLSTLFSTLFIGF